MSTIQYIKGDATAAHADGVVIISHIVNSIGAWGSGFVVAVSRRWSSPELAYRQWSKKPAKASGPLVTETGPFGLGQVQLVKVAPTIYVANMVAQEGIGKRGPNGLLPSEDGPPIRYAALKECLTKLANLALPLDASIAMPRIGCALAGGSWVKVEPLIQETLCAQERPVIVYDYGPYNR